MGPDDRPARQALAKSKRNDALWGVVSLVAGVSGPRFRGDRGVRR